MTTLSTTTTTDWLTTAAQTPCVASIEAATEHQNQLTKPPGSLGRLEQLAVQLAGLQATTHPHIGPVHISIFAGDHGIARAGVSAFPQAVTGQMIANFASGGAAIAVLARELGAQLRVANLGTAEPQPPIQGVEDHQLAAGTENFAETSAMSPEQLAQALAIGRQHIDDMQQSDLHSSHSSNALFIGGEMGIGNTTSASALAALLLQQPVAELVGPGTGVNTATQQRKCELIEQALELHQLSHKEPLRALQCVGGLEIAALTGAYIRAAQRGVACLVDGFIASTAALVACHINPSVQPWLILGHSSAEPGHRKVIAGLQLEPVIAMNLRLGEGSGAACALPMLRLACALHNQMATFASAGVSQE